jgi:hypothetical protein
VPEMQVDANISRLNGIIYANVDSTYQTKTVYKLGDIYNAPIKIAYDRIDAYYPIPLNATNISIIMDDKELDWTYRNRDFSHLFDIDMPELNWTISPVPQEFSVTTHYEYPIPTTGTTYAHLGNYAFLFPLESRYGLDAISAQYPGYSWFAWNNFGNPVAHFNIAVEPILTYIQVYSIDNRGALTPLNLTLSRDNKIAFDLPLAAWSSGPAPAPFGIVLVFNENQETSEPFPTTLVIASLASVAVIGVGLLVYFRKRNH